MMTPEDILSGLTTQEFCRKVYIFESLESTNTYAKLLQEEDAPHGTLILTEEQTGGRGRLGREWLSEKGKNLLFTLVIRPTMSTGRAQLLPFAAALAVCDALVRETDVEIDLKWPNDVLSGGKKLCGILMESTLQDTKISQILLGIGLNVNQTQFQGEIEQTATSIAMMTGKEFDRVSLLQQIAQELELRYIQLQRFNPSLLIDEWKKKSSMLGNRVSILEEGNRFNAVAVDVTYEGSLLIETAGGLRREVYAGDVTLSQWKG